ncbi:hypothetical protein ACLB2K_066362 [Fragaria x ananassa]
MGEALFELENILRSKQAKLTLDETRVLSAYKSKAMREFTFGGLAAGLVAWTASSKLSKMIRLNISGGAAAIFGLWRFSRALDSCVEHILALHGSRMQAELATIMVTKYQSDRQRMLLVSKQFYWTPTATLQMIRTASPMVTIKIPLMVIPETPKVASRPTNKRRINFDPRRVPMNSNVGASADPFEDIFGYQSPKEEIHLPDTSSVSPKAQAHNRRRSHRKRFAHHQEDLSNLQHV